MAITVTQKTTDLKTLFNDVQEIYFKGSEIKTADFGKAFSADFELPVLDDVTFNTGEADVTSIKLTTGAVWTNKAKKGDADISFKVPSIAGVINQTFMGGYKAIAAGTAGNLVDGATYAGGAYSTEPKKVTGALIMFSEDRQTLIALPNIEAYASFVAVDGDNPAYYNVKVNPLKNSEGVDLMVLWRTDSAQQNVQNSGGDFD